MILRFSLQAMLCMSLMLVISTQVQAARWNQNWDMQAEAITRFLDFSELDAGGSRVHEHGPLFGLDLQAQRMIGSRGLFIETGFMQYGGSVEYDGRTDTGAEHNTNSIESVLDARIGLGRRFSTWQSRNAVEVFSTIGFHYWMRDIKTRNRVVGSYGRYQWFYLELGGRGQLWSKNKWHLMSEMRFSKSFLPRIRLNLKRSDLADRVLQPASHYGVALVLPVEYHASNTLRFSFSSSVQFWELGKSPSVILQTPDGYPAVVNGAGNIYEPHSSTLMWGLSLGLEKRF